MYKNERVEKANGLLLMKKILRCNDRGGTDEACCILLFMVKCCNIRKNKRENRKEYPHKLSCWERK